MIPTVSVLLPTRDALAFLPDAVASVLTQTETAFELVVVDDGSRDGTSAYLAGVKDDRLRVVTLPARVGVTTALNAGLRVCRAPFIARLDADDVMRRDRLAIQLAYLARRTSIGVLGTWSLLRYPDGRVERQALPEHPEEIRAALRWRNPIAHPTVMLRRSLLERVGGYDERYPVAQDYKLWADLARITDLANLPTAATMRRQHPGQVSERKKWSRRWAQVRVQAREWASALRTSGSLALAKAGA